MSYVRRPNLLCLDGQPLETRIECALNRMVPRLLRQFPSLRDEIALLEVLEEAGRRITVTEERVGTLMNLHGYAWVVVRSVATSFMRRGAARLVRDTLTAEACDAVLKSSPSGIGSADEIERNILLRELMDGLTREERLVCGAKAAGFTAEQIANRLGRTVSAVDTIFSRAKEKLRKRLAPEGRSPQTER